MKGIRTRFPKYALVAFLAVSVLTLSANLAQAQGFFNLASLKGVFVFTGEDLGSDAPTPSFGVALIDGAGKVLGGIVTINMSNPVPPPKRTTVTARITGGTFTVDHPLGGFGRGSVVIDGGPLGVHTLRFHYIITAATHGAHRIANELYAIQDDIDPFSGGVGVLNIKRR